MDNLIAAICRQSGVTYKHHEPVHGGDINDTYRVNTEQGNFFLKLNKADAFPGMFTSEADGLQALAKSGELKVPAVVATGETGGWQFLLLEYIDIGRPASDFWPKFARAIARMHKQTNEAFGWQQSNYIGSLPQTNSWDADWASFYAEQRLKPLAWRLYKRGDFAGSDLENFESLAGRLHSLFPPERPALLHGDLWSGNFLSDPCGAPAIFDPAVYFGHREMDIGMTKLFGGFSNEFYDHYNRYVALEKNWEERLPLTQLYPLLAHAVLFGGVYVSNCREIFRRYC
jgi:fructosamine-3-kinase